MLRHNIHINPCTTSDNVVAHIECYGFPTTHFIHIVSHLRYIILYYSIMFKIDTLDYTQKVTNAFLNVNNPFLE